MQQALKFIFYYFVLSFIFWASARYAYRVNDQLPAGDPKKKDFPPAAANIMLIAWPFIIVASILLVIGSIILYIIRALLFGAFLVLFTLALVFIRKPFLLIWLKKFAGKIGYVLLEMNTLLIKLIRRLWSSIPQPI